MQIYLWMNFGILMRKYQQKLDHSSLCLLKFPPLAQRILKHSHKSPPCHIQMSQIKRDRSEWLQAQQMDSWQIWMQGDGKACPLDESEKLMEVIFYSNRLHSHSMIASDYHLQTLSNDSYTLLLVVCLHNSIHPHSSLTYCIISWHLQL